MDFKQKVLKIVKNIPKGEFLSYQQVAKLAGNKKAARAVGNFMAQNQNPAVFCHRVVKSNSEVGGYSGGHKLGWKKLGLLLREGVIAVMPTDTIYGICGSALNRKTVEKIYQLKQRSPGKPMIILISDLAELSLFGVKPSLKELKILKKLWPGRISIILPIKNKDKKESLFYLHRGTSGLSFRLPKDKFLLKILKISGPVVAPSANLEDKEPAGTINQARKYFGNSVVYYAGKKVYSKEPSTLIRFSNRKIEVLRKGADYKMLPLYLSK
ncbi:MAG: L-threonylcarbamoyladenylate synthase [Patescibacteria group bacterium]